MILYADTVTESMQRAIDETNRRREVQLKYNEEHGITPETVRKAIRKGIEEEIQARKIEREAAGADEVRYISQEYLNELEAEMLAAAENLEFERAANLRDKILDLKKKMGESIPVGDADTPGFAPNGKRGRRGGGRRGKGKGRGLPRPGSPSQTWRRLNDGRPMPSVHVDVLDLLELADFHVGPADHDEAALDDRQHPVEEPRPLKLAGRLPRVSIVTENLQVSIQRADVQRAIGGEGGTAEAIEPAPFQSRSLTPRARLRIEHVHLRRRPALLLHAADRVDPAIMGRDGQSAALERRRRQGFPLRIVGRQIHRPGGVVPDGILFAPQLPATDHVQRIAEDGCIERRAGFRQRGEFLPVALLRVEDSNVVLRLEYVVFAFVIQSRETTEAVQFAVVSDQCQPLQTRAGRHLLPLPGFCRSSFHRVSDCDVFE